MIDFTKYLKKNQTTETKDYKMALVAKEEKTYEPIPTGMQQAVCAMVCDIGTHEGTYEGRPNIRHQIVVIWELDEKNAEGRPFQASKFYTLSLGEKANLRKDLESWRGQKFTADELKGFDLERLVGVNCFLNVVENDGKTKIAAITPLAKNMPKIKQSNLQEPDWVGKMRAKSVEHAGKGSADAGSPHGGLAPTTEDDLPF